MIENALSPAKVIFVAADEEAREAQVIVPDYQLSLAIGKEGQNARLAARLTGFKIDIKSETQPESPVSSTRWRLDTSRALRKDCRRAWKPTISPIMRNYPLIFLQNLRQKRKLKVF